MENEEKLTEEERRNVLEYAEILRGIHDRLAKEGYFTPGGTWDIFKCTESTGGKIRRK